MLPVVVSPVLPWDAHTHTHTSSAWPATGDHTSCLLSRNPAHQQHQPVGSAKQADGTAISSLSPALSHHHMHCSSPRVAFPIMIHPRAITNLRFRRLPHLGFKEPTVVRRPAVQCPVAPQLHQLHISLLRRHQNQRHFRCWVSFPETLVSHVSRLPALARSTLLLGWWKCNNTPPRNNPISL